MNAKSIITVILFSLLIGVSIFMGEKLVKQVQGQRGITQPSVLSANPQTVSPSPKPSLPPITKSSDLKEEVNKLAPPDFSADFDKLKQEVNQ